MLVWAAGGCAPAGGQPSAEAGALVSDGPSTSQPVTASSTVAPSHADASALDGGAADGAAYSDANLADTWCSTQHDADFCADFDQNEALASGWSSATAYGGAATQLSTDLFASAPNAFRASIPARGDGGPFSAASQLTEMLAVADPSRIEARFEFDAFLDPVSLPDGGQGAIQIAMLLGNGISTVALRASPGNVWRVYLDPGDGEVASNFSLTGAPPTRAWSRFVLDVVFAHAPAGRITVDVDGHTLAQASNLTTLAGPLRAVRGVAGLQLTSPPTGASSVTYDNVVLELAAPS
jgi:hypothetical protein